MAVVTPVTPEKGVGKLRTEIGPEFNRKRSPSNVCSDGHEVQYLTDESESDV
ncbi:MAG: hypothetical protein Q9170_007970 [Blastenia crenularia]